MAVVAIADSVVVVVGVAVVVGVSGVVVKVFNLIFKRVWKRSDGLGRRGRHGGTLEWGLEVHLRVGMIVVAGAAIVLVGC